MVRCDWSSDVCSSDLIVHFYINIDPYANAFNEEANGAGHQTDHTKMND